MKLNDLLFEEKEQEEPEGISEAGIEYYRDPILGLDKYGRGKLAVKMAQFSILTQTKLSLKEFWEKREEKRLIDQFIRATLSLGKKYGLSDKYTFANYEDVVDQLFGTQKRQLDVVFEMEPGFDFKGNFREDKFSITKVRHDKEEAETGAWAAKEKKELEKIK